MKTQNRIFPRILLTLLLWAFPSFGLNGWAGETVDHSLYGQLLERYVKDDVVDYRGFQNEESKLDKYLKILENVRTEDLPRNEQFAFYINAYNAWTVKLILTGYPGIKSIKDLGSVFKSPWKKKICRIDGDLITLDDIEHNILRPRFRDPRVHFAVNCASKGCPPLRSQPYVGRMLDQQLNETTTAFINDPDRTRLEGCTLYVSKIFDWFSEDFDEDVVDFVSKYAEGDLKENLDAQKKDIKVKYLDYDWSLNGK
jgi:hypothetical protein